MKINKRKLSHWLYLMLFGLNVLLAMLLRPFRRHRGRKKIVLYGHKLNGNLLSIYRYLKDAKGSDMDAVFLTMDPEYFRLLASAGDTCCLATSLRSALLLSAADAVISDHGLHVLGLMLGRTSLKFFDVWHGIPFKGFDATDFRVQHRFDETWVASPLLQQLYTQRFGFPLERVHVTGYARTDRLIEGLESREAIRESLGLSRFARCKYVLFAPTWKQDSDDRSIFPFGREEEDFLRELSEVCQSRNAVVLVRKHLNSDMASAGLYENVVYLPYAIFPDTEEILLVSDILVCDWSSISFDYLLLKRPTIFLDVNPPFRKGFSLGPEYRFGAVVPSMRLLLDHVVRYLDAPESYHAEFGDASDRIRQQIYGDYADAQSSGRCVQRLAQSPP